MLKFIILLIFATSLTIPLQSVDGLSCDYPKSIPDPNYKYDPDTFSMQSCVPNPDYNPPPLEQVPIEALLQALDTIDDLLDTIDELESTATATEQSPTESTSILDNPTILILLILVIVILIIMIRNNLGNRNN